MDILFSGKDTRDFCHGEHVRWVWKETGHVRCTLLDFENYVRDNGVRTDVHYCLEICRYLIEKLRDLYTRS